MPRNMSFALTTQQIRDRSKTVTRRFGWWFLKPGDVVNAVEKAMGLSRGERMVRLCQIRITSVRSEPLDAITPSDCHREGFPDFVPADFVGMITSHYGCPPDKTVNRIEFEYIEDPSQCPA
ncbi:ASCH domain-containing protein [uncultured Sulfitobacter sp.]|uniref:ASCH domain-containing protein n=1 Tax=uncultured Sulfitobacter sp. TaxID=191468 RepID=UPI002633CA52|nr:ASCH domain-containing protein [uncultured Sulfitobacter sp.]